jgi:YbbR domain-containing protein
MIAYLRGLVERDFWLKLFSLALAILIWLTVSFARSGVGQSFFAGGKSQEQTYFNIPVQVRFSATTAVRSFKVDPIVVAVTVRGEKRALQKLQSREILALVDLAGIEEAARGFRKQIDVTTPPGITFVQVVPDEVEVIVPAAK